VLNPYPIQMTQHEDRSFRISLKQSGGLPLNLAGASVSAQVRDIDLSLVANLSIDVINGTAGEIIVSPPVGGMIKAGRFVWDLVITIAEIDRYLPISTFTVLPSATKPGGVA
jgi:hypothetical protein